MPYSAEISRSNPTCFVFVLDQSGSMADSFGAGDLDLRRDLKRRCHRLREHGNIVRNRVGDAMQIPLRHGDQIGERAVVVEDPEDRAIWTMRRKTAPARLALPAGAVDLAHHPLSCQRTRLSDADELMAQDATEAHVALDQLQVGFTHPGAGDAHHDFLGGRRGSRANHVYLNVVFLKNDCAHT